MKSFVRILSGCFLALIFAALLGLIVPRPFFAVSAAASDPDAKRVFVLSGVIHSDIAVPLDDTVRRRFAFLEQAGVAIASPDAKYLTVGRGSRAFFLATPSWSEIRPGPTLKAMTVDRAAMHVDVTGPLADAPPQVVGYEIGAAGFDALLDYIEDSFNRETGNPVPIHGATYNGADRFYEAGGLYTVLINCNNWTAGGLRAAGLRTGFWNPLPQMLDAGLGLHN